VLNAFPVNMNEIINNLTHEGVWALIKSSEIVIGDSETRVSPIKGKHSSFATKIDFTDYNKNTEQLELFDK
jgi:hypothetical protein